MLDNPYIPWKPTLKQAAFLLRDEKEVFYGGAARGGKTAALLMAALMYAEVPNYRALLMRRTFAELNLPRGLFDLSREWLRGKADYNGQDHRWNFPGGASLTFGYMDTVGDEDRYLSSDYHFIGYDEMTQFSARQYISMITRLTQGRDDWVPTRMRGASNPGGIGHDWVKAMYIIPASDALAAEGRAFVPASLVDNPHINRADYEDNLNRLAIINAVRAAQLRYGDWNVSGSGDMFKRSAIPPLLDALMPVLRTVRYWDMAATAPKPGRDPDYTVGLKLGEKDGRYCIMDVVRIRAPPMETEARILQTAQLDGRNVEIRMEEEGGSSGKGMTDHYSRVVLKGYAFQGVRSTGDKATRARAASAAWAQGNVSVVNAEWTEALLSELEAFPEGSHDDQVDAMSGSFNALNQGMGSGIVSVDIQRLLGGM